MAFVVEAPGAALPFSLSSLLSTLEAASSNDVSQRQIAGQQLSSSSWQGHADYFPHLQTIFLDNTIPRDIRFLAIIQFKNGIDAFWRSHAVKNAIPPAQKQLVRSRLFRGSMEVRDQQLAVHNALVIAKIVRIDFPGEWPEALSTLIDQLKVLRDDDQSLPGALLILLRIVRELGTARLLKSQKALQAVTPELVQILGEIYDAKTRFWLAFMAGEHGDEGRAVAAMGISLSTFRILRRLLIVGYDFPHREQIVQQIWTFSQSQFGQLLNLITEKYPAIGDHLFQFSKFHISMATTHPGSFAALPGSPDLVRSYWNIVTEFSLVYNQSGGIRPGSTSSEVKPNVDGSLFERFALKGLLLMRACVKLTHHRVVGIRYRSKEDAQEQQEAIINLQKQLFSDDFVNQIAHTIITHLFVFREADMGAWEQDPEEWEHREESQGNAYEWEVRPCAERLFLDLLTCYKDLLSAPLLAYFATAYDPQATLAAKDAIYTTLGLAAALVEKTFDFDSLLKSVIATDAAQAAPRCQIIRRRIAILLSQWIPVKSSVEARPLVYEIFRHLLNSNDAHNDIVVRITAARQFKAVVDEFHFDPARFVDHAPHVLRELVNLVQIVEIDETKLAIIETLRSLISRMETSITQYADLVMDALPDIWRSAGDLGFMMKQAVLAILISLVVAMRADSQRYHHLMLPLITEATQPGSEAYLYLMDDALDLWFHLLQNSHPPLGPYHLLNLVAVGIKLLSDETEHAEACISIVGTYITLAPRALLNDEHRKPLLKSLLIVLQSKHHDLMNVATKYIDMTIRLSHQHGGDEGFQLLMQDVVEVGFLKHILEGIHDAYEARQTLGPKRRQSRLDPFNVASYFSMLARIAAVNPSMFVQMLEAFGPLESVWAWLSAEWFLCFDTIAEPDRLKLNLLGITRLLELPQPMASLVLAKLQDYMSMWTTVICQFWDADAPGHDGLVETEKPPATEWDTYKDVLERELYSTDPIRTVSSLGFVQERLQGLSQIVGEQTFQEWLGNVDKEVVTGFQKIGT